MPGIARPRGGRPPGCSAALYGKASSNGPSGRKGEVSPARGAVGLCPAALARLGSGQDRENRPSADLTKRSAIPGPTRGHRPTAGGRPPGCSAALYGAPHLQRSFEAIALSIARPGGGRAMPGGAYRALFRAGKRIADHPQLGQIAYRTGPQQRASPDRGRALRRCRSVLYGAAPGPLRGALAVTRRPPGGRWSGAARGATRLLTGPGEAPPAGLAARQDKADVRHAGLEREKSLTAKVKVF